jgi:hypothetical protein
MGMHPPGPTSAGHFPAPTANPRPVPAGNRIVRAPGGNEVRTRPNGRPADVRVVSRNMEIHHGLGGERRVLVERPDHSRVYVGPAGRGYVQRPYVYRGYEYGHRTYVYNGRVYDRFYRPYPYHGVYVHVYAPVYYYRPAFYGWVYNPWAVPITYSWGWGGYPWYGYYGYYFSPYPSYASASLWLTDYLIATSLAAAYQAQVNAAAAAAVAQAQADASPLSPQVKDLIAAEVQRQIALENAEAQNQGADINAGSSGIQRMLTDNVQHVFIVGASLDVVDAEGAECSVSDGDALQLPANSVVPADATSANLVVLAAKGGHECRRGSTITVALTDLQEMQNHMREVIGQGMGELQAKQGSAGLPRIPPSASAAPQKASFAVEAPPPDANAATELKQEASTADQAEHEVLTQVAQNAGAGPSGSSVAEAPPAPAADAVPPTISTGQSIDEVKATLGSPVDIFNAGNKTIYKYKDMKITFKDGKVSDVQ